ncbi:MAG: N-acetylglucosaminyldiphosphoundecaprenol N-acetyl-beta-D-mannosaminyltransferase [Verrucomicrobiota bacterium]|jgi:UDP-N-acetyl-D-mannosaminuronic acid transferase (WecB/TagA/CpsF family)
MKNPNPSAPETCQVLGVRFFNGHVDLAVDLISERGGLVVAPAAPALVKLQNDEGYRAALTSADLAIADSGFMVLLWKIFSGEKLERISGLKFLKRLVLRLVTKPDERVLWILPSEAARGKTVEWLRASGLREAIDDCHIAPRYAAVIEDRQLLDKIDIQKPRHIVVGIGGGVQEKLGFYLRENLSYRPAIHCIGAALGFLTGDQPPIPMWADTFYLGWLLRLLRQPKVFGPRYLSAFKLPFLIFKYRESLPPLR